MKVPGLTPHSDHQRPTLISLRRVRIAAGISMILAILFGIGITAGAHGGKAHSASGIDAFKALQAAMSLYDRLLTHGKLDETWETDLTAVTITPTDVAGEGGFSVSFQRRQGEPSKVYFFLTPTGAYAGSNFTGP